MFKVTARDQGHYKGHSGAFVTYCNISCLIIIRHTHTNTHTHQHISFRVILAGILRAGKKHYLGDLAVRFVCRMRSTFANPRIAHALSESL